MALVRRAHEAPALLSPADLDPVRAVAGDGALDYALVLVTFHFINRVADLLGVEPEALPAPLRRLEPLRRLGVRVASRLLARMDLANRAYSQSWETVLRLAEPLLARGVDGPLADALAPLRPRPKLVEALLLAVEERDARSSLPAATIARVQRVVEGALPRHRDEATGFHARPADPVDAFAFVGTRYAARATPALVDALRRTGLDDLAILDLAIAVADANQWARLSRLLGLPPGLFYLPAATAHSM